MKKTISGFTLIELLISMTIFFIMVTLTYANYAYFQNIAKVKISLKEISQSIHEAKNLATSGYQKNAINQSVALYFDTTQPNLITYYHFNYNSGVILDEGNIYKTKKLQSDIKITDLSGKQNILIYFSSIYGSGNIFYYEAGVQKDFGKEINMKIAFKNATGFPLERNLKYITNTHLVDY